MLALLNETFSVIFKHDTTLGLRWFKPFQGIVGIVTFYDAMTKVSSPKFCRCQNGQFISLVWTTFFLDLYMKKDPNISTFTLSMQSKHEMLINRINEVSIGNVFLIVERRRRRSREKRWKRNWGLPFWLFSSLQF